MVHKAVFKPLIQEQLPYTLNHIVNYGQIDFSLQNKETFWGRVWEQIRESELANESSKWRKVALFTTGPVLVSMFWMKKWLRSSNNNLWQHYASVNDDNGGFVYINFVSSVDAGDNNQHRWR